MSDITITAANVVAAATAEKEQGTFGATLIQGKAVYKDTTTKKYLASDNDGSGTRRVDGITLNAGSDGQPADIVKSGDVTIGATLVAGTTYCLSGTAGGICPQADVASGHDVVVIGVAKTTAILHVDIQTPGVTL